jgi:hypothetical protein
MLTVMMMIMIILIRLRNSMETGIKRMVVEEEEMLPRWWRMDRCPIVIRTKKKKKTRYYCDIITPTII